MVTRSEDMKILEKVLDLVKKELNPVEYTKFLTLITPKIGDSVKEIRKFRATIERGLVEFEKMAPPVGINVEGTFYIYQSFGFPPEMTFQVT